MMQKSSERIQKNRLYFCIKLFSFFCEYYQRASYLITLSQTNNNKKKYYINEKNVSNIHAQAQR